MPALKTVAVRDLATVHEVLRITGAGSRQTLKYWRRQMEFPQPIKTVGKRVELWDLGHVRAWLAWKQLRRVEGIECAILEPGILEIREGELCGQFVVGTRDGLRRVFPDSDKSITQSWPAPILPRHAMKRASPAGQPQRPAR